MKTPIKDFAKKYALAKPVRLHMPGHKGVSFFGCEKYDLTEVDGADVLYSPAGIIEESMANATSLFGSERTLYSTEGSSLSIRAILHLVKGYAIEQNKKPKVLAYRNAHKSFVTACALLEVDVKWLYGNSNGILSCSFDLSTLESAIIKEKPSAVFVTSPDYLGGVAPIAQIADVCHKHGVIFAVDNAHGAYLKFTSKGGHPIDLGADLVCDSAHKTLPVLTGGAYLHISKNAPKYFAKNALSALSLHASTSPSYLILQSLDNTNGILAKNPCYFDGAIQRVAKLKAILTDKGFNVVGDEEMKLTISTKPYGYTGKEVAEYLKKNNVFVEFCDNDFVTMMFSPCNNKKDFAKTAKALLSLQRKTAINTTAPSAKEMKTGMSMTEAIFAPFETIDVDNAEGRILSSPTVSCPPAIPIVVCGEIIDHHAIEMMKYYSIKTCNVVKNKSVTTKSNVFARFFRQ